LANAEAQVPARSAPTWLGLAGTVTSLAALDAGLTHYDPTRTHGYRLTRARVEALHDELCALPVEARAARLLEPQRAGVILGGTLVLVEILSYFERAEIVVSERDILDGLAASLR
jgi:exopolyphosphatase/guanosine-5'-triphosphate,3'-diphosphate pyrophosphatase